MEVLFYRKNSVYLRPIFNQKHVSASMLLLRFMANIPQSEYLSTANLSRVFINTTATYKFYWFQSILQMHTEEGAYKMDV